MSNINAITYSDAVAVTKSDSTADAKGPFAGLLVTATGTVSFVTTGGNTISLTGVAANAILPISCVRVNSTGTAATVLGLYAAPTFQQPLNPGAGP